MKFSDIEAAKWESLKPYLDTVVLPLTGLSGIESPAEVTYQLELLRDWLDPIEQQFNGRIVTYPAFHYTTDDYSSINRLIDELKQQGFKYVIVVSAKYDFPVEPINCDAYYMPQNEHELPIFETASHVVLKMWTHK